MGVKISVEGGEYGESECVGAKRGTTITVRELFYNTPARFKFLKKDSAETAAAADICKKKHPDRKGLDVFAFAGLAPSSFHTIKFRFFVRKSKLTV